MTLAAIRRAPAPTGVACRGADLMGATADVAGDTHPGVGIAPRDAAACPGVADIAAAQADPVDLWVAPAARAVGAVHPSSRALCPRLDVRPDMDAAHLALLDVPPLAPRGARQAGQPARAARPREAAAALRGDAAAAAAPSAAPVPVLPRADECLAARSGPVLALVFQGVAQALAWARQRAPVLRLRVPQQPPVLRPVLVLEQAPASEQARVPRRQAAALRR